jgi:hypothetical protein
MAVMGSAQFVADDADEFVFHAIDFIAFADVLGGTRRPVT